MRNTLFAGLALSALAAMPAAAASVPLSLPDAPPASALLIQPPAAALAALASVQQGRVQVWMDGSRDLYQPGERMGVRVRSDQDGYLAVFHIDTNGDVDVIFPRSEYDDGWVEGGRTLRLGSRGGYDYVRSRGGYGIGYIMAVTLDEPLELWRVRELYGVRTAGWDGNRSIFGDPFYAMDELARAVVPESAYGYESVDYATYHVGRRYRYPRYACYDAYGDWYHHRGAYWDDCDRVRVLLVSYPWYYDTHRWHGSRRVYYERYYYRTARNRPLHGYKERTNGQAPPARSTSSVRRPEPQRRPAPGGSSGYDRPRGGTATDGAGTSTRRPRPSSTGGAAARPGGVADRTDGGSYSRPGRGTVSGDSRGGDGGPSQRPTRGSTRPQQSDRDGVAQDPPVQPTRDRPTFQRRPPSESQPRRESPPARSEPRREPARTEPRRTSEPRRESPPARSVEPRRESRPPSSSGSSRASSGSRSSGGSRSAPAPRSRTPDE